MKRTKIIKNYCNKLGIKTDMKFFLPHFIVCFLILWETKFRANKNPSNEFPKFNNIFPADAFPNSICVANFQLKTARALEQRTDGPRTKVSFFSEKS